MIYMFAEKACFNVLCKCKATSLSKMAKLVWRYSDDARATIVSVYKFCKEQKNNIRIEIKQSIGYTGSKFRRRKDLIHMKFTYTRCGVN